MSNPQYSAIIPSFNRARTLPRALASVRSQTMPPAEILVVDDGSTDDTIALLSSCPDAALRVISHPTNMGASAARNTGARAASSPWIAFLDSDDAWLPDKMARQMAVLAAAIPAAQASVTGYCILDERHGRKETFIPVARDVELDAIAGGCRLSPGSTLVVSRDAYLELGGLDTTLPRLEDWDWLIRYLEHRTLAAVSEPLVIVHKGSDPSYAHVKASVQRLATLHRDFWYRRSWLIGRTFDSTLLIEEAAGALYGGERRKAVMLTLRALATYPFRAPSFYAKLARHAVIRTARIPRHRTASADRRTGLET